MDKDFQKWLSSQSVLVVEDSAFDRALVLAALEKLEVRNVQIAENGSIAMRKIEVSVEIGKPFQIILLDWKMPAQDGESILRWIRSEYKMRSMSVIMTTGSSAKSDVKLIIADGADSFVVKPVTLEVLQEKFTQLFNKKFKNAG